MAYQICARKNNRWILIFRIDKGKEGRSSRVVYPHENEFKELGLQVEMTLEQAREVLKISQADQKLRARDRRRNAIIERVQKDLDIKAAYLPDSIVNDFETNYVGKKGIREPHWIAAKKYIANVKMEPSKWYDECEVFYDLLEADARSLDYTQRIIRTINEYGALYCKTLGKYWRDIKNPKGYQRKRIRKAYKRKIQALGRPLYCPRIDPIELEQKKSQFKEEEYNWLFVSLHFGLRPIEADEITKDPWRFKIWFDKRLNKKILTVLQSKVDDSEKHIPILYPEQEKASELIQQSKFKPPSLKKMKRVFGKPVWQNSCRKGFVNIMDDHGHSIQEVSFWLGHNDVSTTITYYWDIKRPVLEKKGA